MTVEGDDGPPQSQTWREVVDGLGVHVRHGPTSERTTRLLEELGPSDLAQGRELRARGASWRGSGAIP